MRQRRLPLVLMKTAIAISLVAIAPHIGFTATAEKDASLSGAGGVGYVEELSDLQERIELSTRTIQTMASRPEEKIPVQIIQDAAAIAIFPEVTKVALGVGGRYGGGILMMHRNNEWSGPIYLSLYGASVGAQLGAEQSDLIMVFTNQDSLDDFSDGELQVGAEASIAAGTWGAKAGASTQADILAYQQTSGVFAGIALSGAVLNSERENNETFFSHENGYVGDEKVFAGEEKLPKTDKIEPLIEALNNYTQQK